MSHPIRRLNDLAECCVFVKQSVDPFHCDRLHFELHSKGKAPKKLRSPTSRHSGGQPARCLEFGAWRFGICSTLLSAKWSRHPFFRSYGARLPSSLTRFHSRAWVYSTHPPVSDSGTGNRGNTRKVFLVPVLRDPVQPRPPRPPPCGGDRHFQSAAHLYRNVASELNHSRCRNIKPAFHRLRPSAST